jgi:N-methylhydantoinase A/oxoprolinase/acetone carboxylase beta subunit
VSSKSFVIGIDTGGTYTDAVVIERNSQRILSSAKSITTKGDLAVGVGLAMQAAVSELKSQIKPEDIKLVSISTTLATNAVVEGHGGSAAVILIGFDDKMVERTGIAAAFADMPIIRITGGHDHNGDMAAPLDNTALKTALENLQGRVTAIAIASTFAVRNNVHELAARTLVQQALSLPVTLSSELSSALDAPRRALTSVLNARLVGHIAHLIAAVKRAMTTMSIDCPLMIMKGDGALTSAESVVQRPIETILSGPAASLVGAKWLSGLDNFLMSDMGGTTTDVGILENGQPLVAPHGAEVGGWRTMVKAIDVKTIGLGGDSEISIGLNGKIDVGPQRAVPLSLLAQRKPQLIAMLEVDLTETEGGSLLGRFLVLPFGRHTATPPAGLNARETEILAALSDNPIPMRKIAVSSAAQRAVTSLRRKGLLQVSALTPSDAAHVLDLQDNWAKQAAVLGAKLLAKHRTMVRPNEKVLRDFCQEIWSITVAKSARIIADTALGDVTDSNSLIDAVCEGRPLVGRARVAIAPQVPIVAVGGPVRVYYTEVARRLGTDVIFAPYCDVANAVGAAAAMVAERIIVTVEGDGNGTFRVHGGGVAEQFASGTKALERAKEIASQRAKTQALDQGATDPQLEVTVEKQHLPEATNDDGLLTATVTASAIGRPVEG